MAQDPDATRERYEGDTQERSWDANIKHTYDERAGLSVNVLRQAQQELAQINTVTLSAIERSNNIVAQAQQNAVETANLAAKQAIRHSDIAVDGQWNPVQQGAADAITIRAVSLDDAALKAIGAIVAAALAEAVAKKA